MGHARAAYVCDCVHENVKRHIRIPNIIQLSIDGRNINCNFSNKFEKMKETKFKTDLVNLGSCSFTNCNVFRKGQCSIGSQDFIF